MIFLPDHQSPCYVCHHKVYSASIGSTEPQRPKISVTCIAPVGVYPCFLGQTGYYFGPLHMGQCSSQICNLFFFFQNQRVAFYFFHFGRANILDHRTFLNHMEVEGPCTSVVCIFQAVALTPFILPR